MPSLINNIIDTAYNNDVVYCKYISDPISKLGFMVWFELEQENHGCIFCSDINERYGEDAMLVVPDHLRHAVLRRHLHQHVDMVRHHVPLQHPAFFLLRQPPEFPPQLLSYLPVQLFLPVLRYEHDMILAFILRMVYTFIV